MKERSKLNTITEYRSFVQSVTVPDLYLVSNFDDIRSLIESFDVQDTQNKHESYYLLSTSGSEKKKYVLHTSSSIKNATESFLKTHPLNSNDRWWLSLSTHHVAGFSILARSYFANIKPPYEKEFVLNNIIIEQEKISLLSLVPTQIFDIVSKSLKAPTSLKYVFVGGAPLSKGLFLKAKSLGWPIVPCFGATETFAQFSSSSDNSSYSVFDDWSLKTNSENELMVSGPGLYDSEVFPDGKIVKRQSAWCNLKDKVSVEGQKFIFLKRNDDFYKQKGSFKSFSEVLKKFETLCIEFNINPMKVFVVVLEEERSGAGLYLISSDLEASNKILDSLDDLRGVFLFKEISFLKSEIHKPVKAKIEDVLQRTLLFL